MNILHANYKLDERWLRAADTNCEFRSLLPGASRKYSGRIGTVAPIAYEYAERRRGRRKRRVFALKEREREREPLPLDRMSRDHRGTIARFKTKKTITLTSRSFCFFFNPSGNPLPYYFIIYLRFRGMSISISVFNSRSTAVTAFPFSDMLPCISPNSLFSAFNFILQFNKKK